MTAALTEIAEMLDAEVLGSDEFWMHLRADDGLTWVVEQHGGDAFLFRAHSDDGPWSETFAESSPERVAATISSPTWQEPTVTLEAA